MPQLSIGAISVEVEAGKRLVLAIEEQGLHIGHRCGGIAKCTTCRVSFDTGEPASMTRAEYEKLSERELLGKWRLACQISCDHDMAIAEVGMTKENQGWTDTGPQPDSAVQPATERFSLEELQGE